MNKYWLDANDWSLLSFNNWGFDFWDTSNHWSFDSTFVVSSFDSEISVVSPTLVPWVSNQPVRHAVLNSPSDDFNGMSSQSRSSGMMINSCFVGQEVGINGESSLNWTVGHDFSLDLFDAWWNWVNSVSKPFIAAVCSTIDAFILAFWCWLTWTTWSVFSRNVVITWGEKVRLTIFSSFVKSSSNNTGSLKPVPSSWWVSSVASVSTSASTAGQKILSWDSGLKSLVADDADSVTHGFNSTECPAWPTRGLISDFSDWITLWPVGGWREFSWNVFERLNFFEWEFHFLWSFENGSH